MNEHDLHASFDALARRNADEHVDRIWDGTGLSARDVVRRATRARRRRAGITAVTGVAAVAGLVLAGSALAQRPDPQPANTPTPEITRPLPAPTPTTEAPVAPDPALDDRPVADATGLVRPYPTAPGTAWTALADDLWTSPRDAQAQAVFGDVSASYPMYPGFRALSAAGTWLTAAGSGPESNLVGLDATTGATRWTWEPGGEPGTVLSCGGVDDDAFVCLVRATNGTVVQLRDAPTGAAVRDIAPGGSGIAVVGDTLLVHDVAGERDIRATLYDLATGETKTVVDIPGIWDPDAATGDGVVYWQQSGSVVVVHGYQYQFAMDVRTGAVLGKSLTGVGVRGDGWATGTAADGSTHAVGPDGQDLVLAGVPTATLAIWAPARDVTVPLLTGSDPYDGVADVVRAADPATGAELWSVPGADTVVAVAGRTAVLLSGGELLAVDLVTGTERWRAAYAEVTATDGERLLVSGHGRATALDLADGTEAWSLEIGAEAALVRVDDTLAVLAPAPTTEATGGALRALVR